MIECRGTRKKKELIIKVLGMVILNNLREEGEYIAETEKGQGRGRKLRQC